MKIIHAADTMLVTAQQEIVRAEKSGDALYAVRSFHTLQHHPSVESVIVVCLKVMIGITIIRWITEEETDNVFFEAIRLGAALKPQAFGVVFNGIGTCAMGAAADAIGMLDKYCIDYVQLWPVTFMLHLQTCPVCLRKGDTCQTGTIPHLNDTHKWTRTQIADWIEPIELAWHAAQQPVITEECVAVVA